MFLRRNGVGVRFAAMYGAISCLFVLVAIVAPAAADDPLPDLTLHYYWDSGLDGARWVTPLIAPGDVNGDGYDDVIVYRQDQKLALAYLGSSEGLSDTNVRAVPIGEKPRTYRWHATGDLNNDGFADMAEIRQLSGGNLEFKMSWGGAEAFAYQEFTIPAPSLADTGLSELKAGDLNGDGFSDLFLGLESVEGPRAAVIYGKPKPAELKIDVLIDYEFPEPPEQEEDITGSAFGPAGGEGRLSWCEEIQDYSVGSIALNGDLNDDGYPDVVVAMTHLYGYFCDDCVCGEYWNDQAMAVHYGSAQGIDPTPDRIIAYENVLGPWTDDDAPTFYPVAVTGWTPDIDGDWNGDGVDDLLFSVTAFVQDESIRSISGASIMFGSPVGLGPSPEQSFFTDQPHDREPSRISYVGDLDNDRRSDAISTFRKPQSYVIEKWCIYLSRSEGMSRSCDQSIDDESLPFFPVGVMVVGDVNDDLEEDFLFAGYGTYVDNNPIGDLAVVLGPNVNEDAATANDVGELPSVFHGNLAGAADDVSGDCGGDGGPDRSYRLEAAAQNDYRVVLTSDEGVPLVLHRPAPASQGKSSTCVVTAEEGEGAAAAMTATLDISGEEGERVFYVDALAPTNDAPFTVAVLWLNAPTTTTTTTTTTSTTSTTIAGTTTSTLSTTSTTGVPSTTSPPTTTTTIPAEDDDDDVSDDDSAGDGAASEADDGDDDSSGCGR